MNIRNLTEEELIALRCDRRYTAAQRGDADRELIRRADLVRINVRRPITIKKLDTAILEGDWHDRPLRWVVNGPGSERQLFATKKDACTYRAIRRRSAMQGQAIQRFANTI